MAMDEYFLELTENSHIDGILRIYNWQPCSLSFGYFFRTKYFKQNNINTDNIKLVRRITGGNAILHGNDITYSLIVRKGILTIADKRQYYIFIAEILKDALENLGIEVKINSRTLVGEISQDCFSSVSQYEITDSSGVKLIGSAQKVLKNSLLQHGSFFISYDQEKILKYINFNIKAKEVKKKNSLNETQVILQLKAAFSKKFNLQNYNLEQNDHSALRKLVSIKYATDKWNYYL